MKFSEAAGTVLFLAFMVAMYALFSGHPSLFDALIERAMTSSTSCK